MRAIILAAGRGSRMKNLTDECPKCLLELRGKKLLEWQLQAIRGAGIKDVAIVTGYKRELLAPYGLVEFHNPRWSETNMVSSLACAAEWLQAEPCLVSYSDIFYSSSAVLSLANCMAPLALTYDPNWRQLWESRFEDPLSDAETFVMDADGNLLEIGQKPNHIGEVQGQYMGLLKFTPTAWAKIEEVRSELSENKRDRIDMTGLLRVLIVEDKVKIFAIPYNDEWGEVDNIDDLKLYNYR